MKARNRKPTLPPRLKATLERVKQLARKVRKLRRKDPLWELRAEEEGEIL